MFISSIVFAQSGPNSLNISGGLFNSNGTPITNSNVNFKIEVYDKNATCLMYSEQHLGVDLSATKGAFSLIIGAGTSMTNVLESTTAFDSKIFENPGAVAAFTGCPSGLTLNAGDTRLIRVSYNLGSGYIAMTPDIPLTSSAYAMVAETLNGHSSSDFVLTNNNTSLQQANIEYAFSNTNWPVLKSLIDGTSGEYIPSTPTSAVGFNSQRLINVGTPTGAGDAATKGYSDANLGGQPVDMTGVAPGMGGGKILTWDQTLGKWVAGSTGAVGLVASGTGLTGGPITSSGTLSVDVGVTANKILQLNGSAQIPAVNGSLLTNINAVQIQGRDISAVAPAGGNLLGWNATTNMWEATPNPGGTVTGLTGDVSGSGSGVISTTINNNTVTAAKINNTGIAVNRLLITDGTTGATVGYSTCSLGEVLQWSATGWKCESVSLMLGNVGTAGTYGNATQVAQVTVDATGRVTNLTNVNITFPVTSVNGHTGVVNLIPSDITGLGTAAVQNVGLNAGNVLQLMTNNTLPALDGSQLTNLPLTSSQWTTAAPNIYYSLGNVGIGTAAPVFPFDVRMGTGNYSAFFAKNAASSGIALGTDPSGGGSVSGMSSAGASADVRINGNGSGNVVVGNTGGPATNKLEVAGNASVGYFGGTNAAPANGLLVAGNVGIGTTSVTHTLEVGGSINASSIFVNGVAVGTSSGTVSSITAGAGLTGGTISSTGTFNVDIGTTSGKILQLNASAQIPAVDGSLLTNVNATKVGGYAVATTSPAGGQYMGWNNTTSRWEPMASTTGTVTNIATGTGLTGGPISSTGTLAVDVGVTANKIVQLDGSARLPAVDGSMLTNLAVTSSQWTTNALGIYYNLGNVGIGMTPTSTSRLAVLGGGPNNYVALTMQQTAADATNKVSFIAGARKTNANVPFAEMSNWDDGTTRMVSIGGGNGFGLPDPTKIRLITATTYDETPGAGVERLTVGTNGNVAIGNAAGVNAFSKLDVNGNVSVGSYAGTIAAPANGLIVSGNVGIGTPTPNYKLDVNGTINASAMMVNGVPVGTGSGSVSNVTAGTGLTGGPITTAGTLNVDVGVTANKIVQLDGSSRLPNVDGSQLTNVNAAKVGGYAVATTSPASGQYMGWNNSTSSWEPMATNSGTVTNIATGTGLTGGPISATGTLAVDVGTTANKIVQLDGTARLPAIDGSQLTNLSVASSQWTTSGSNIYYNLGNVGIGTTVPVAAFTMDVGYGSQPEMLLKGNSPSIGFGANAAGTNLANSVGSSISGQNFYSGESNGQSAGISFNTSDRTGANTYTGLMQRMLIDHAGDVAIGAISPEARLTVEASNQPVNSRGQSYIFTSDAQSVDEGGQLTFGGMQDNFAAVDTPFAGIAGRKSNSTNNDRNGYLQLSSSLNGTLTERMRIDQNGNVGIGTTTPGYKLDVAGTVNASAVMINGVPVSAGSGSVGASGAVQASNGSGAFLSNNNIALDTTNVRLGIGTTSPLAKVDFGVSVNGAPAVNFWGTSAGNEHGIGIQSSELQFYVPTGNHFSFNGGGQLNASGTSEVMRITGSGNVGIGTTSPATALQVMGTSNSIPIITTCPSGWCGFQAQAGSMNSEFGVDTGLGAAYFGTNSNDPLMLETNNTERMRITTAGNVGIGTSTPAGPLDVRGGTASSGNGKDITLVGQNGQAAGNTNGGSIWLTPGIANGTGLPGTVGAKGAAGVSSTFAVTNSDTVAETTGSVFVFGLAGASGDTASYVQGYQGGGLTYGPMLINPYGAFVGIGTSTPNYRLDVNGTINASSILVNGVAVGTSSSQWTTSGANIYYNLGNVGIGTSSPAYPLVVGQANAQFQVLPNGGAQVSSVSQWNGYQIFTGGTQVANLSGTAAGNDNGGLSLFNGGAQKVALLASGSSYLNGGNVGIGTATPQGILDVRGGTAAAGVTGTDINIYAQNGGTGGSTNGGNILLNPGTSPSNGPGNVIVGNFGNLGIGSGSGVVWNIGSSGPSIMGQAVPNSMTLSSTGGNDLYISSAGRIGIGTSTPQAILDVQATASGKSAILIPRDTTANRPPTAVNGMIRYNTDMAAFEGFANGAWGNLAGGGASQWTTTGSNIYYNTGSVGIGTTTPAALLDISKNQNNSTTVLLENLKSAGAAADAEFDVKTDAGVFGFGINSTGQSGGAAYIYNYANTGIMIKSAGSLQLGTLGSTAGPDQFLLNDFKNSGTGRPQIVGNWKSSGYWGIGPATTASDNTIRIGNVAGTATDWAASQNTNLSIGGQLGIGTTTPQAAVDISTTGTLSAIIVPRDTTANRPPTGVNGMIRYNKDLSAFEGFANGAWGALGGGGSSQWTTSGSNIYYNLGNVGIGTATPLNKLDVRGFANIGSDTQEGALIIDANIGGGTSNFLTLNNVGMAGTGDGATLMFSAGPIATSVPVGSLTTIFDDNTGTNSAMTFSIDKAGALTEAMRMTHAGNVGIGTATPQALLDIQATASGKSAILLPRGSIAFRPPTGVNGMIRYNSSTNKFEAFENNAWTNMIGGSASFPLTAPNGTAAAPSYSFSASTGSGVYSSATDNLSFSTAGTQRINVDQLGNINMNNNALYVSATGAIGIGTNNPTNMNTNNLLNIQTTDFSGQFMINNFNSTTTDRFPAAIIRNAMGSSTFGGYPWLGLANTRGSESSRTTLSSGDTIGRIVFYGYDGSTESSNNGPYIQSVTTETWGASAHGSNLQFATTANGTSGHTVRMTIDQSGSVGVGTSTPQALLDVQTTTSGQSAILIPRGSSSFRPSGVNGMIRYNSSTSAFEGFANGAWGSLGSGGGSSQWTTSGSSIYYNLGNVGIGTTTPNATLEINMTQASSTGVNVINKSAVAGGQALVHLESDLNSMDIVANGSATGNNIYLNTNSDLNLIPSGDLVISPNWTEQMRVTSGGFVGIGTSTPGYPLDVNGSVRATSFISTSDRRLKTDIQPIEGLDLILKMRGVRYKWKSTGQPDFGVIAQEVEEVLPEAVSTDANGFKAVKYPNLVAPLIESTKELYGMCQASEEQLQSLQTALDAQGRRISSVESENASLRTRVQKLEDENGSLKQRLDAIEKALKANGK